MSGPCINACPEPPIQELFSREPGFRLFRCPDCGHGWTDPAPPDEEIAAYYPPAYYGTNNVRFNPIFEALVKLFRMRRASVIRRRTKPGRVLDVGCGRGLILGALKKSGYEPFGVELSEHAAWHARNAVKASIHIGALETAPFEEGTFGAAIFWHSLEHFRNPLAALKKAESLLKPGGLLVVAVPNSDSLQARLSGANWFHLDIPRHYHHFSLASLKKTIHSSGFKIVQADHFSFEQNPYGWLQSFYNALNFKFNFLYDWLKTPGARSSSLMAHPLQSLATFLLLPFFLPLSIALTMLEAALGRGGTIELYAVKK